MNDKTLILKLGGSTKVARLLGYDLRCGGAQRVANWMARGIPPAVRLQHLELFGNPVAKKKPKKN